MIVLKISNNFKIYGLFLIPELYYVYLIKNDTFICLCASGSLFYPIIRGWYNLSESPINVRSIIIRVKNMQKKFLIC